MRQQKEKIFTYILIGLIVIQPILDLVWLNDGTIGEVFGFTIPTLVRMGVIAVLGIASFFVFKFRKSHLLLVFYVAIIGIYFVLHHMNALEFHSMVPGDFNYSMIGEAFYVVRMCIPIAMMYFVYNSEFGRKEFDISVVGVVLVMSGIEVVTNVFKVAICSYSDRTISGNIFDWFFSRGAYYYNELASKGWFYWSIVSMVLVLLFPYVLYLFIDTKKMRYLGVGILQGIALFMFGTKATSYSVVIVSVLMLVLYFFSTAIKKEYKFNVKIAVVLCVFCIGSVGILQYCPAVSRVYYDEGYQSEIDEEEEKRKEEEEESHEYDFSNGNTSEMIRFFDNNYKFLSINETFLKESYPYKYDPVFWYELYDSMVPSQRMQNRIVQEAVLQRVQQINDNEMDKFLGVGYTRTSTIYNLEKDFVYQYYSMGVVGAALLVGPYIAILLLVMIEMLFCFKRKLTLLNCSLVLGCGLTCCLAYYSGNTLESLGVSIVLGTVYGYLLKSNFKREQPKR